MRASECPDCGSFDTERVHTEFHTDVIETVRICGSCPLEYTVSFSMDFKDVEWRGSDDPDA